MLGKAGKSEDYLLDWNEESPRYSPAIGSAVRHFSDANVACPPVGDFPEDERRHNTWAESTYSARGRFLGYWHGPKARPLGVVPRPSQKWLLANTER